MEEVAKRCWVIAVAICPTMTSCGSYAMKFVVDSIVANLLVF